MLPSTGNGLSSSSDDSQGGGTSGSLIFLYIVLSVMGSAAVLVAVKKVKGRNMIEKQVAVNTDLDLKDDQTAIAVEDKEIV